MEFGLVEDPIEELERRRMAQRCTAELDLEVPAVVDGMDDAVNLAYHGWPERLYLVDRQGVIVYAGGRGPFGFKPQDWEAAIEEHLRTATK